jgi:hypothetical protein
MKEVWQPVVGYEGRYEVSNTGEVNGPRGALKPIFHPKGYVQVVLYSNGTGRRFLIHRLVAIHFIPNPNQCPQVNHKDGNKINNVVSNLEWCTASENNSHAVRLLALHGESRYNCKLTDEQVRSIRSDVRTQREIAAHYRIAQSGVGRIKSGKIWSWVP